MKPSELAERQAVIDEFGEVDRLAKLWKPQVNPHSARKAELQAIMEAWYVDHDAEKGDLLVGNAYQLEVSPQQNERELTPEAKQKAFDQFRRLKVVEDGKLAKFNVLSVWDTTLAAIEKYLGEKFLDKIAPKHRTGRRTYKVVALEAARGKAA